MTTRCLRPLFSLWLAATWTALGIASAMSAAEPLPPPSAASSATFQPRFSRISADEGLSNVDVRAIAQDQDGFMWFGTAFGGLFRYDGYETKHYQHDETDAGSVAHNFIWALLVDRSGTLWVGTNGGGLDRYDRTTDSFVHFSPDPTKPGSLPNNTVRALHEDRAGALWVGTRSGLSRLDRPSGTFENFRPSSALVANAIDSVRSIFEDPATGLLWLGTSEGLVAFDPKTQEFMVFLSQGEKVISNSENAVNGVIKDEAGVFWIMTEGGLKSFVPDVREIPRTPDGPVYPAFDRIRAQPENPHGLSNNLLRGGWLDGKGRLWLATHNGLNLLDRKTRRFTRVYHRPDDTASLSDNAISKIFEDRHGGIWVGTRYNGINRLHSENKEFVVYRHEMNNPNSLSQGSITKLWVDRQGLLWVGTSEGLNRFDGQNWTRYRHDGTDPTSLSSSAIDSIGEDLAGNLWVGTYDAGLNRFEEGAFRRYLAPPGDSDRFARPGPYTGARINGVLPDPAGGLWIAAGDEGLVRYDGKLFTHYPPTGPDGNPQPTLNLKFGFTDAGGVLWFTSEAYGLVCRDPVTGTFTTYPLEPSDPIGDTKKSIYGVVADGQGRFWVSSMHGLLRFDVAARRFTRRYTTADGLPTNVVGDLLEDRAGNFWVSTQQGITRFDPRTGVFRTYDRSDGLPTSQFTVLTAAKGPDGRFYFGSGGGVTAFYPERLRDNPRPPNVVLTGFELFDKPVVAGAPGSPLQEALHVAKSIRLRYDQSVFSFRFSALDFNAPEKNRYAFKMDGFDADWRHSTADRRRVTYTNLAPGHYVFRVRGTNNDGVWSEQDRTIAIHILPPWWGTVWFRGAAGLAFVSLIVGGYRWRVRSIKRRTEELAREVDERTTELQHEVEERKRAEEALLVSNTDLEKRVIERTAELARTNVILQAEGVERLRAESTLRTSEERYRALYEDNPAMYFTLDPAGTVLAINRFGAEQLGYAAEELVGRSILDFFHPEDADTFSHHLAACLKAIGRLERWELRKLRRDGTELWVKELARAVRQADGRLVILVACEDITAKVVLESHLRQGQKMDALGQLAGGVAHDFNNLLTVILGQAETCEFPGLAEQERDEAMREIKATARRAANLTRQLLVFSRRQTMHRVPQDLGEIVKGVAQMLGRLIGENIALRTEVAPGAFPLLADAGMIEQVLVNMAVNARDAMPGGGELVLRATLVSPTDEDLQGHPEARATEYVCLSVTDTGSGIPDAVLPRIFEPFFTTKEIGRGTGLGLATSLGIVQQHGGWIDVASDAGVGTTFKIYLPRRPERAPVPATADERGPLPGGSETILLVEDEAAVRRSISLTLQKHGYRVREAANGAEALAVWSQHRDSIQLLLTDLVMPGELTGRALARRLLATKPELKVGLMTGYDPGVLPGEVDGDLPFAAPLMKPFRMADLLQFIRERLAS